MDTRKYFRRLIAAITVAAAITSWAAPVELDVSAYERWKVQAEKSVEERLKKEFSDREAQLETLSTPFKIGETVTITLVQGPRKWQISGKFKGIEGNNALIGERKPLLSDIDQVDANKLYFGQNPQMLQLKLEQLRRDLELEKTKLRQVYLDQAARQAGYTSDFFESSIELSGRYWPYAELGESKLEARAVISATDPYVDVIVFNRSGTACSAGFFLDNKPVSCTLQSDGTEAPAYAESPWSQHRFRLHKEDLGDNPVATIGRSLRIWVVRNEVGSWQFQANRSENRNGTIVIGFDMPHLRIKPHSNANVSNMGKVAQLAAKYQKAIDDVITARDDAAAAAAAATAAAAAKLAEELAARKKAQADAYEQRRKAELGYIWLTTEQAKQLNAGVRIDREVVTNAIFDNINFPTTATLNKTEYKVTRFTDWEKKNTTVPPRDPVAVYEVVALKYRLLRLMYPDVHARKLAALQAAGTIAPTDPAAAVSQPGGGAVPYEGNPLAFEGSPGGGFPGEFDPRGGYDPSTRPEASRQPLPPGQLSPEQIALKLEEPDDADMEDARPDPGYVLQYRASYQNRLTREVEFTATMVAPLRNGEELKWEETYSVGAQFLGPLYGGFMLTAEKLEQGIKGLTIEGKVAGAEQEKERLERERQELIKKGTPPLTPSTPGGSNSGGGGKTPAKGLFD